MASFPSINFFIGKLRSAVPAPAHCSHKYSYQQGNCDKILFRKGMRRIVCYTLKQLNYILYQIAEKVKFCRIFLCFIFCIIKTRTAKKQSSLFFCRSFFECFFITIHSIASFFPVWARGNEQRERGCPCADIFAHTVF